MARAIAAAAISLLFSIRSPFLLDAGIASSNAILLENLLDFGVE
jgi:hypothetical protein